MSAKTEDAKADYRGTLFLPQTDFPMRAGLPQKEPELLARWHGMGLYRRLREAAKGRTRYILHDGPPYANGHLHIGHALNKILKDVVTRSQQMLGFDANYVPGWDCHGLPIEWKIEEQYRARGRNKDEVPVNEFRKECREFAEHWIKVQSDEFQRLGVTGDFDDPYTTMAFKAEAVIAAELMKFAMSGQLYRGSKPVMWSVVERTALAEAEIEYHDYTSDTVWVKFPVRSVSRHGAVADPQGVLDAYVLIWTTTPWTLPGNRAISFSSKISYGLYQLVSTENDYGPRPGEKIIVADKLSEACSTRAKVTLERLGDVDPSTIICRHPLAGLAGGYEFSVPLFDGEHVTEAEGTGFVHTAPGHGREDFEIWVENAPFRGVDPTIPFTVDADGFFTSDAPGLEGRRVITDTGEKGDANEAVIKALIEANMLFARGRLKHQYPHSWRSKKPVIFRNTPQWFVHMDRPFSLPLPGGERPAAQHTLRELALKAIDETRFVPASGLNRLRGMIAERPDWVLSRQRAWGVPITVFRNTNPKSDFEGETLPGSHPDWREESEELVKRITAAFEQEGADAWFADGAKQRFLSGLVDDPDEWEQVSDILDVWFDSGSTHAFVIEGRPDLKVTRALDGGKDYVLYLEGSDQHRGWFHSSLLESCGTRGHAPYDAVLTHGFVMDEQGRKMSKSLGNIVAPQDVMKQSGADILRLWVMSSDYAEDLRIGPEILKSNADAYRRLRNTIRFMLGNLAGFSEAERVPAPDMPELERWVLHRLAELDGQVRKGYADFAFQRVFSALFNFCTVDLSAICFDIRKDALYCDPASSPRRRSCRTVLDELFHCVVRWLAPMLCFTTEEAWLARFPGADGSVHLELFPDRDRIAAWRDDALAAKWRQVRAVRRVVTGALEIERQDKKRIGASLEARPVVHVDRDDLWQAVQGTDFSFAELAITSGLDLVRGAAPEGAFALADVPGVGVVVELAEGEKCARCWMVLPEVGTVPGHEDLCRRCADAVGQAG